MFDLVLDPGTGDQQRLPFDVTPADIDDAADYGRAQRSDPPDRRRNDAAYHKVLEGLVATVEQVCDQPWVLVRDGRIVARNAGAADITEADLR